MCIMALEDPETMKARKAPSVDWAGIALLIVAVGSLQMVLERGHRLDWFESREITTFTILAVAGAIAFVWRELTAEHPVVDLRVLKHRSLAVGCTYGTLIGLGLYGSIFLFPVYTQTLLRWTAWQSGLAALPSSIATAIMMGFAGRLSRGSGLGAMFVPLSVATLGGLPMAAIPQGAGLYSLFRQLGGSAGVALLATILEQRTAVHRAQLADHVSLLDAETWTRLSTLTAGFMQRGLDLASAQTASLTLLAGTLKAQASMLAFSDCYRFVLLLFVVCTPLAFLLRRPALFRPPA
jgi:DHA2 family multidrug resistance protein